MKRRTPFVALVVVTAFGATAHAQNTGPAPTNPGDTRDTNTPGNTQAGPGMQNAVGAQPNSVVTPTSTVNVQSVSVNTPPIRLGSPPLSAGAASMAPMLPALPDSIRAQPGGLTANSAAQQALSGRSPGVMIARANLRIAQASASEALRSMIPQISGSFRYSRLSPYTIGSFSLFNTPACLADQAMCISDPTNPRYQIPLSLGTAILDQYDLRLTVTVPLSDLPLRLFPNYQAAQLSAEAQELNMESARQQVGLEAREAFYEYVRALGQAFLVDGQVEAVRRHRDDVARALEAGTLSRSDQLRIDAQLINTQRLASAAHEQLSLQEAVVRQRLHLNPTEPITIGEAMDTIPSVPGDLDALVRQATDSRPDIQALDRLQRSLDRTIFAVHAGQFPSVAVTGNVDYLNPNTRAFPITQRWDTTWDVNLLVSWSPTQAFVADATADRLRAQQALYAAQQQQLREVTEITVRQLYMAARLALAQLQSSNSALASAEEVLRVRRERVSAGAAVVTDLFDAEVDVLSARLGLINANIDFRVAFARLQRAVGRREPLSQARRD